MKLAKKILVAMLALALLTSAFLFNATATDAFNAPGMDDIEDILEYYTLEDYLADNYNDGNWTSDLFTTTGSTEVVADPTNATNKVLASHLPFGKKGGYEMSAPSASRKEGLTDKLFLTFKIYFDEYCTENAFYELQVGTVNDQDVVSTSKFTILQFNFSKNKNGGVPGFYYSSWDPTNLSFSSTVTAVEGLTPKVNTWYDVVISVNAADEFYSFDITEVGGTDKYSSGKLSIEGAKALWGFNCYGQFMNPRGDRKATATYYLDDMEIYEGSYTRMPSLKDEVTTTHLADLKALYNAPTTDYDTKYRIASVLDYLYNEADTFNVANALPEARQYINEVYAQAFTEIVGGINSKLSYYERLDYVADIAFYNDKLPAPADLSTAPGITAELAAAVVSAREIYSNELAGLNDIKSQSDAFITLMNGYDATNKDYVYIYDYIAEASDSKYEKRDASYEGIEAAEAIFAGLKNKADAMIADVDVFVGAVDKMEAATTFGPLFAAYLEAHAAYTKYGTDAVINPDLDNDTKAGLPEKIASYESKVEDILAKAFICDEFNRIIKEATISSYYTSLVAEITEATAVRAQFGEYEMDYPGIAESVATYEAFVEAIANSETKVEAYITAVNAIATKVTFAEKKAAINAALALKVTGDVLGVEGVVEANIALTNAEAEINLLEGNSTTLISLVEQIKAAKTLAQKRALIHLANVSAANAEDTYTGVTEAKADLAAEIAAFEAAVAAANGAVESALKSAQAVVCAVIG